MTQFPKNLVFPEPAIILVTGPSGCGKTQTLPLLLEAFEEQREKSVPKSDRTVPLLDAWDQPTETNAKHLHTVGLSDPFTWCRTYAELSDGQKARFNAAEMIYGSPGIVVIDEWLNQLDRLTARATAWSTGRALRREAKTALLLTSQDDIVEDLAPDIHIQMNWSDEPTITEKTDTGPRCSIVDEVSYRPGARKDYNHLAPLHYQGGHPATVHSYHVLEHPKLSYPAAVAILSYPDAHSAARNLATDGRYKIQGDPRKLHLLSREVLKLTRIIVAPELRACGLATILISHLVGTTNAKYIECVTALGRYNKFLERSGFTEIVQTPSAAEAQLMDLCVQCQVPPNVLLSPTEFATWIDRQSVRRRRRLRRAVWHAYHQLVLHRRTRAPVVQKVPDPADERWTEAFAVSAARVHERPTYYILELDQQAVA